MLNRQSGLSFGLRSLFDNNDNHIAVSKLSFQLLTVNESSDSTFWNLDTTPPCLRGLLLSSRWPWRMLNHFPSMWIIMADSCTGPSLPSLNTGYLKNRLPDEDRHPLTKTYVWTSLLKISVLTEERHSCLDFGMVQNWNWMLIDSASDIEFEGKPIPKSFSVIHIGVHIYVSEFHCCYTFYLHIYLSISQTIFGNCTCMYYLHIRQWEMIIQWLLQ